MHAREPHGLVVLHQAAEQGRDLGARAVAREQAALVHVAVRLGEQLADLRERGRALADGLVLVAQHEEVRAREVARQHHELRERVVLHLVHHDVARVLVAPPGHKEPQVEPLAGAHGLGAQHAHGHAIEAQPCEAVHLVVRGGQALLEPLAREGDGLLLVLGAHSLAKEAHLLVHVEAEHLLLQLLVAGHGGDLSAHAIVEVVGHEGAEARTHAKARELLHGGRHLAVLEQGHVLAADVAQVVGAQHEVGQLRLEALQGGRVGALAQVSAAGTLGLAEVAPGVDLRVRLAHRGQHVVDVVLEHGVGAKEVHLAGGERLTLAVEQIRDALQHDAGLSRARDAVHEQRRHVLVAHDEVLLALDRGRNVAELLGVVAAQRPQKQRVLDGHGGVEVGVDLVARDVELAAELELYGADAAVHGVARGAVFLVVVRLGDGVSPVHDERAAALVGHAGRADVDVARGAVGCHLEAYLGEVGLAQEEQHAAQLIDGEVVVLVVGIDDGVERLDGGECLHDLVVGYARDVRANLGGELAQVGRGVGVAVLEGVGELVADALELGVDGVEVGLLLGEDGVVGRVLGLGLVGGA